MSREMRENRNSLIEPFRTGAGSFSHGTVTGIRTAAILDVDYTLIPGTSVERLFLRYLWNQGGLHFRDILRAGWSLMARSRGPFLLRVKTDKSYLAKWSVEALGRIVRDFVNERIRPAVSRNARLVIADHRQKDRRILLLTGCPEILIRPLAADLRIDWIIGTRLEERDGRFTGRLVPPHPYGEAKRKLLAGWAETQSIRLDQSYAYADSPADQAVLSAVGYPYVVNPGSRMKHIAAGLDWPILNW